MTFDEYLEYLEEYWSIFEMPSRKFDADKFKDLRL